MTYKSKKKRTLLLVLILFVMILGLGVYYLFTKPRLSFINNPTIEICSKFHPEDYIKNVEGGQKKEITCDSSFLNTHRLGTYEVTYQYRNKDYKLKIKVIDTKKPSIEGLDEMMVKIDTQPDFKNGIILKDNSGETPKLTINTDKLNMSKEGTYTIRYIATDKAKNKTIEKRKVTVVKQLIIGTSIPSNEKVVYLTFDDGPSQNTKRILDILDQYNIKATFFVTGNNQEYNQYIKEAYDKGHTIGLHTYCHDYDKVYASVDSYFEDLKQLETMLQELIGYTPHYLRFPGGSSNTVSRKYCNGIMTDLTAEVIQRGYQYYDWNCSTGDAGGNNVPVETLLQNCTQQTDNNLVILAHDTDAKNTTVEALPKIIEHYQGLGYTFKGIDDQSYYAHQHVNN